MALTMDDLRQMARRAKDQHEAKMRQALMGNDCVVDHHIFTSPQLAELVAIAMLGHPDRRLPEMATRPEDAGEMTIERAEDINARLVRAYAIRERIQEGDRVPYMGDVSLEEATRATQMIIARGPVKTTDTTTRLTCNIEPTRLPRLFAWIMHENSLAPAYPPAETQPMKAARP